MINRILISNSRTLDKSWNFEVSWSESHMNPWHTACTILYGEQKSRPRSDHWLQRFYFLRTIVAFAGPRLLRQISIWLSRFVLVRWQQCMSAVQCALINLSGIPPLRFSSVCGDKLETQISSLSLHFVPVGLRMRLLAEHEDGICHP